MAEQLTIEKIDDYRWRIPKTGGMRVPGLLFVDERILKDVKIDESPRQVANVAHLPGIIRNSLAMPDMHWGYGFPIGGVAATDLDNGVISPGGVGYDINCGCRLLTTDLGLEDVEPRLSDLVAGLFRDVPCGVGSTGEIKLSVEEEKKVLVQGAAWAPERLGTWVYPGWRRGGCALAWRVFLLEFCPNNSHSLAAIPLKW